ncbi:MAG: excinuclease ABC subunit UvrC [Desulfovibrionaceae bacterium]|nr:excinuclease ABC subunit UvrC [Desulfovibrionaceae bacterium]MBF0512949.1 excinuclease ABC subunit UvrC [Desulfovibrionaceae bacterium]
MKNASGRIVYVGKAKSLRARLSSYFRGSDHTPKTRVLVSLIAAIDTLLTGSEKEALLLEASLIKKHKPRYNIVLRDDKSYVLFKLDKSSAYPRLSMTRRVAADGSTYYGPFTSAASARATWRELTRIFAIRKCSDASFANRARPCLYHHLGQCGAPCKGLVAPEDYAAVVRQVEAFLAGRSKELIVNLEKEMREASAGLQYERAAKLRDLIRAMRDTVEGQAAVLPGMGDLDALGYHVSERGLAASLVFVRQGRVLDRTNFYWPRLTGADVLEALSGLPAQFYGPGRFIPPRLIVPFALPDAAAIAEALAVHRGAPVKISAARGAKEKGLIEIANANAGEAARERERRLAADPASLLAVALHLSREAKRIETVDISHLGGGGVVAGQVVYEDGRLKTEDYRHYKLEAAEGSSDDYLALAAWAARRAASGEPWPDLVLIDGGRGQLAAVQRALDEAGAAGRFELAAIVKESHAASALEDAVYRPGRKNPLPLKPGSPELLFLQHLRDAAHRFALSRQRRSRKAAALQSRVLDIPGVGPKTARLLWDRFDSVEAMAKATAEDLASLGLGLERASRLAGKLAKILERGGESGEKPFVNKGFLPRTPSS